MRASDRSRYAFDAEYGSDRRPGFERNGCASIPLLHLPQAHPCSVCAAQILTSFGECADT